MLLRRRHLAVSGYKTLRRDDPDAAARFMEVSHAYQTLSNPQRRAKYDKEGLAAVFAQHSVGAVIHFAGLKAVGESVAQPLMYYQVNVEGTLNLLEAMADAGVGDIVKASMTHRPKGKLVLTVSKQ